ncbi:cysteine--tRNA ligase, partial [Candidatus Bathyarchaeota archaeon]|nr:cysteine--tRNA ligase [Candidatus Bathyarchaeota archaeon]
MGNPKGEIYLFNTLTRRKERFVPIEKGKVRMYCCGPTVYWYAHIGNFRTYIFEDVLRRVLEFNGLEVKHVMNITDVGHLTSDADTGEDKMEVGAKRERKTVWEIADFYTGKFFEDAERLNILKPTIVCRATDHISDMISFIKKLEGRGYTYIIDDGVYFDTSKLKNYGKLTGMDFEKLNENLKAGARVEFNPNKRNVTDFCLWRFSPRDRKRQMEWESPWGVGFPGWHIECTVMGMKYLGENFDIHCGGIDHIPIHHTNEIAQAEAVTGKPLANYWLHGAFLVFGKSMKMAKSAGEIITVQTLVDEGFDPLAFRYLCLTAHYRSELVFTWESLKSAQNALFTLREHVRSLAENLESEKSRSPKFEEYHEQFLKIINDDLNMPKALALTWTLVREEKTLTNREKYDLLMEFDKVFALDLARYVQMERL